LYYVQNGKGETMKKEKCLYCKKKFSLGKSMDGHVRRVHAKREERAAIFNKEEESKSLIRFAMKIKKLPEKFNVPAEYAGAFIHHD